MAKGREISTYQARQIVYVSEALSKPQKHPTSINYAIHDSWLDKGITHSSEKRSKKESHHTKRHRTRDDIRNEPEYQLHRKQKYSVEQQHAGFSEAMCWLGEEEAPETESAVESRWDVTHS
jgi:hypothetical protein